MNSKVRRVGTLLVAFGCASMSPACVAQASWRSAETNDAEYVSTSAADGSENSAESAAPAAAAAVTTEGAPAAVPGVELRSAIVKELEAMKQRIAELEAELAAGSGANASDAAKA